jgi:hypothetical protein
MIILLALIGALVLAGLAGWLADSRDPDFSLGQVRRFRPPPGSDQG